MKQIKLLFSVLAVVFAITLTFTACKGKCEKGEKCDKTEQCCKGDEKCCDKCSDECTPDNKCCDKCTKEECKKEEKACCDKDSASTEGETVTTETQKVTDSISM
ncbi:MAG: hypothetical protein H6553_10870 [Chitinophagales bacterium]|nr:hypothetical protein [Chitinophagales bacterium]